MAIDPAVASRHMYVGDRLSDVADIVVDVAIVRGKELARQLTAQLVGQHEDDVAVFWHGFVPLRSLLRVAIGRIAAAAAVPSPLLDDEERYLELARALCH